MNDIIKKIYIALKEAYPKVYQNEADENETYPFVTFNVQVGYAEDSKHVDTLVVEVWDEKENTIEIENIADDVKNILDYKIIDDDTFNTAIYFETRKNSTQADDEVGCRELRFELQTYYKKEGVYNG